jgi:hypothetical protein
MLTFLLKNTKGDAALRVEAAIKRKKQPKQVAFF